MLGEKWTVAMNGYLARIKTDHENRFREIRFMDVDVDVKNDLVDKFNSQIRYEVKQKYVKVISGKLVHSFIVLDRISFKNGVTFEAGDILMPASWSSPAKNKARGNIFGEYSVKWTGTN